MNRIKWVFVILFFVLAFTPEYTSPLLAQESETEEFTLEEITVTAQKREENQQKVPIAMEVISGDILEESGKDDIDEILNNISSITIGQFEDGLRVSIRSMSNDNGVFMNMQVSTPTVAVNKDGVYSNRNTGNTNLYDIERVEVLFGPQSTMYASATPGGIVNVITADPKTDKYEASGILEYGNYNLLHTEGSLNAPVSDIIALRAAFTTSVRDGYLTNGGMDDDTKSARLKALFQPSDNFSLLLAGEITNTGGQGFASVVQFEYQDDVTNPWTATSDTPGNENKRKSKKVYASINWDMGDFASLTIIPSYTTSSNYRTGASSMFGIEYQTTDEGSGYEKGIEARLTSSPDSPFTWILGANIYRSWDEQSSISFEQGDDDPDVPDQIGDRWNDQDIKAIYGNITYPVTDRFRATGGIRKTWDEITSYNHQKPGRPPTPLESFEGAHMEYDDPNFKLGFEYDLSPSSMLYGDLTTSYRTQSAGTMGAADKPAEELTAYSIGAKNRFFGNKLQVNASAYFYDYKNYFTPAGPLMTITDENNNGIRDWDDVNGNGIHDPGEAWLENTLTRDTTQLNCGDAEVYGFDLQTSTIITPKDRLDLSVSYIKKKFTKLFFDYWDITNWLGMPDIDYSGKEMPKAPNWTANLNFSHIFSLPNRGTLTPRVEYRYQSEYILDFKAYEVSMSRDPVTGEVTMSKKDVSDVRVQEAYTIGDLSMLYTNPDGKWTLNFYVKNITDYAVKRGMFQASFLIGPPRTYGATLSMRF